MKQISEFPGWCGPGQETGPEKEGDLGLNPLPPAWRTAANRTAPAPQLPSSAYELKGNL